MNEIQRILALSPGQRTKADLDYLAQHKSEMTDEQKKQLEDEEGDTEDTDLEEDDEDDEVVETKAASPLAKNIGAKVFKQFKTVIKELSNGHLLAIVNSGQEDRHGEILSIKGLDIAKYMTNPILADGHDYSQPSVGVTHKIVKKKNGSIEAEFSFATDVDLYDKPKILDQLYRKGYQFAFSIGFIPFEAEGNTYTKSEMIEFSPVLIGADAQALLKSKELLKQKGIDINFSTDQNGGTMNLQELLKKLREQGLKALTMGEVAFIKEHKSELSEAELAECKEIFAEDNSLAKSVEKLAETVGQVAKDVAEIKTADPVERKDINIDKTKAPASGKDLSKEMKLLYYVRGVKSGNFKQYIDAVGKAAADPMNTGDDSQVVPPAEFIAEVERLEEEFGVASRDANVRRSTRGAGIIYVMGDDDLEIFDTEEGGRKRSTRLSYKQKTLAWKKWAGILPMTDELSEDSAIDLWADATQRFARAFSRKEDQLVFTANLSGGKNKKGILYETGTNEVLVPGDMADITYENLVDMIYGVPSQSGNTGKFYLNRTILPILAKLKDEEGRPLWLPSLSQGVPSTILGRPYVETEVLPGFVENDLNLPFMVYGNLRYVTLGIRKDIQMKMFDTGIVGGVGEEDEDENTINLLTQDAQALRAVKRMNAVVRFPEAFSVLKTGNAS